MWFFIHRKKECGDKPETALYGWEGESDRGTDDLPSPPAKPADAPVGQGGSDNIDKQAGEVQRGTLQSITAWKYISPHFKSVKYTQGQT